MDVTNRYSGFTPALSIGVQTLYTIHYYENYKNYYFPGESHRFWELVYVDRGEVIVETDWLAESITLKTGWLILHRPNEFHSFYANNLTPHNIVVLSFDLIGPATDYFMEHPLHEVPPAQRDLIALIVKEAESAFQNSLAEEHVNRLRLRADAPFGAQQLLTNALESLLLQLQRKGIAAGEGHAAAHEPHNDTYVDAAIEYLKTNVCKTVALADVCDHVRISRAQLQKTFKSQTGQSVMRYLSLLRCEEAKYLIRSRDLNFTQIAEHLCYSSVHHFSHQFRQMCGMSPSEYAASIQHIVDTQERIITGE